jgi:hypothetical protein
LCIHTYHISIAFWFIQHNGMLSRRSDVITVILIFMKIMKLHQDNSSFNFIILKTFSVLWAALLHYKVQTYLMQYVLNIAFKLPSSGLWRPMFWKSFASLISPWRWRQQEPPKWWCLTTSLHSHKPEECDTYLALTRHVLQEPGQQNVSFWLVEN